MITRWICKTFPSLTVSDSKYREVFGNKALLSGSCATHDSRGNLPCGWFTETVVVVGADPQTIVLPECVGCASPTWNESCPFFVEAGIQRKACFAVSNVLDYNSGGRASFGFPLKPLSCDDPMAEYAFSVHKIRPDARLHSDRSGQAWIEVNGIKVLSCDVNRRSNTNPAEFCPDLDNFNPYGQSY